MTPNDYKYVALVVGVTWAVFTVGAWIWLGEAFR